MKKKLLVLVFLGLLIGSIFFVESNLGAYPSTASPCGDCHLLDPAVTLNLVQQNCGGFNATYSIEINGPYNGQKGWGVYYRNANTWVGNYASVNRFSVPIGWTVDVWGVNDGSLNGLGGSATEVLTAACGAYCPDNDNDGYVVCDGNCTVPAGKQCGDCDDNDPTVHPGAVEGPYGSPTCSDGKDNNCNGLIDAQDPGCAPPPATDYDISGFTCSSKVTVGKLISLKVTVKNQLTTDYGATMTVSGNQGAVNGGGTFIPIATNIPVSDPPGDAGTAYSFTYTPTARGTITWTATVNDTNPDVDQAICTTIVH